MHSGNLAIQVMKMMLAHLQAPPSMLWLQTAVARCLSVLLDAVDLTVVSPKPQLTEVLRSKLVVVYAAGLPQKSKRAVLLLAADSADFPALKSGGSELASK